MFLKGHIIGGVDTAFAQAYPERFVFEVTIENNVSKVSTMMTVFAGSDQDAKDQVSLNGWTVISVKKLTENQVKNFNLSADTINTVTPKSVKIESSLKRNEVDSAFGEINTGTDDKSGYPPIVVSKDEPKESGREVADNLDLLPSSPELEFISVYYFDSGIIEPVRNPVSDGKMRLLDKNGFYVVFGHADEVPVGGNAPYGSNFELSFKRAEYIRDMMIKTGMPADRVRIVGLGSNYPTVKESDNGALANRRVEIYGFRTKK